MADERKKSAPVGSSREKPGRKKAAAEEPATAPRRKAPGPGGCRRFARARMAEAMPELVGALIEQSQGGSLGHMKLLVELSGLNQAVPTAKERRKREDGTLKAQVDAWRAAALKRRDDAAKTT